jgi:hypothetical protein
MRSSLHGPDAINAGPPKCSKNLPLDESKGGDELRLGYEDPILNRILRKFQMLLHVDETVRTGNHGYAPAIFSYQADFCPLSLISSQLESVSSAISAKQIDHPRTLLSCFFVLISSIVE